MNELLLKFGCDHKTEAAHLLKEHKWNSITLAPNVQEMMTTILQEKPNEGTSDSESDKEVKATSRAIKPKGKNEKKKKPRRSPTPAPRTKVQAEQQNQDSEMAEDEADTDSNILVKMELDNSWKQMYIRKGDRSDRIWACCQTAMNKAHYYGIGFEVQSYGAPIPVND